MMPLSTGDSLKAACLVEGQAVARNGFGDGLLTSIEYRNNEILEIPFRTSYHIFYRLS
jgi:hypothetical protein